MRTLTPLLALTLAACGGANECGWGTHEEDGLCVAGALGEAFDDDPCEPHPTVPEEYEFLWYTDGCTTSQGKPGNQAYALMNGRTNADGTFTGTEKWYWYFGEPGCYNDCVDTIEITAEWAAIDYSTMTCGECEQGWYVTRKVVENNCDLSYGPFLTAYTESRGDEDDTRSNEEPESLVMFDTHTPTGPRYEENRMLVVSVYEDQYGQIRAGHANVDWAIGHAFPDDEDAGPPPQDGDYDWLAEFCYPAR